MGEIKEVRYTGKTGSNFFYGEDLSSVSVGDTANYVYYKTDTDTTLLAQYQRTGQIEWTLNYYNVVKTDTFATDITTYKTTYDLTFLSSDTAHYADKTGTMIENVYQYQRNAWYIIYLPIEFIELAPDSALSFRTNLNTNFTTVTGAQNNVEANLTALRDSLHTVAFSGEAKDLTQDSAHRLITDVERTRWNNRVWVAFEDNKIHLFTDVDGTLTDITQNITEWIEASMPTKTSELINDSDFVTTTQISSDSVVSLTNQLAEFTDATTEETTGSLNRKGTVVLPDEYQSVSDQVPIIIFEDQQLLDYRFSSTCYFEKNASDKWCVIFFSNNTSNSMLISNLLLVKPNSNSIPSNTEEE